MSYVVVIQEVESLCSLAIVTHDYYEEIMKKNLVHPIELRDLEDVPPELICRIEQIAGMPFREFDSGRTYLFGKQEKQDLLYLMEQENKHNFK